jgi:hypothetical protein
MTGHPNRGRVTILPLDSRYHQVHYNALLARVPHGWNVEGLIDGGLLVRSVHSQALMMWTGDRMVSVDRSKAEAALMSSRKRDADRNTRPEMKVDD